MQLSKNIIRNLAADEKVYARGLQYYQNGRIVNASYSKLNKKYKVVVKGNYNYTVIVEERENDQFECTCNCPSTSRERGLCKHSIAALFMLLKHQERLAGNLPKNPEEKRAYQVLEYFDNQDDMIMTGDVFRIEPVISLPDMLRNDSGKAYISLRVGGSRMYKVQNIKKFLEDYIKQNNIVMGKEFKFIAGESAFDRSSKNILDFLLSVYDITEQFIEKDSSEIFNRAQVALPKFLFIKFLRLLENTSFELELYGVAYEDIKCIAHNPNIEIELTTDEECIFVDYKDKEPVIPVSENGEILYRDRFLYLPDKDFLRYFLPFFNNLGGDRTPLSFNGVYKNRFLESVLPKLNGFMDISVPEELKDSYISPDLNVEIYLDKYQNYVKAEVKYIYDKYSFNSFAVPQTNGLIILRQRDKEKVIIDQLESFGFEPHSGFYLLKADKEIYDFFTTYVEELKNNATVFYSDSFKKMRTKHSGHFSIGLRVSNSIDLMDVDINYGDITKQELMQLFRAYRLKRKFFRLSDGSFIDLESKEIDEIVNVLDNMNISAKERETKENFHVAKGLALFVDDLFSETQIQVEKNEEFKKLFEAVLGNNDKEYDIPDGINANLRPYQIVGYKWMMSLADHQLGGILADDMGLGKTLQAITYIKKMSQINPDGRFLVVCPTSLVLNWMDEFENFAPDLRCIIVSGTPEERQKIIAKGVQEYDVLITSYPLLRRDILLYDNTEFNTVFLDEAQFIKNAASLNAKSVKSLHALHRFALTGTPIENSLSELWSIFDYLMPYYLLTHQAFVNIYEKQILKNDETALESLNKRTRPFILRRMKSDVLTELPEKVETKYMTEMTDEQKNLYLSYLEKFRGEFTEELESSDIDKSRFQILAALTRLRQICCHPGTFIDNYEGDSGKLDLFLQILPGLIDNGHRILVFSQFTSMLEIIKASLDEIGYEYFYLEGSTKVSDRNDYVKRFNNGEGTIFLISLKAGGTGLNLIGADTVIHFDPWWNPAVEEQATDRAHRIGQEKSVQVIKLITKGTIEEKIYKLQRKKKELSDSVIESKEVLINMLSKEELNELFTYEM